jgi:antitoxin component YwqK of YwqJK toxin-antitoxin module
MGKVMSKPEVRREYYVNGNVMYESHYLDGKMHREDGPAYIFYYPNGNVYSDYHYIKGKLHREDGPAIVEYYNSHSEYYINGKNLSKEDWYSRLSAEQKVNLLYGKGNE